MQGNQQEADGGQGIHGMCPILLYAIQNNQPTSLGRKVRNEISVLKKVSAGHKNIVTLYDYFEVSYQRPYLRVIRNPDDFGDS